LKPRMKCWVRCWIPSANKATFCQLCPLAALSAFLHFSFLFSPLKI
jgi:hypothetical protein